MTTSLKKAVKRVSSATVRDTGKFRPLIVTLYPGDMIGLRPQGTRREELYPLQHLYYVAIKARVNVERMEKAKAKKARGRK